MPTNTLTDSQCRAAKPSEKGCKLFDGGGLFLYISPTGSKTWRLVSRSLRGFFWLSVAIATAGTLAGILLPIELDLPVPSGAAIILFTGIVFLVAAFARGAVPALRGNPA